jgi:hypothetical protein
MQLVDRASAQILNTSPMESAINAQQTNMPRLKLIRKRVVSVLAWLLLLLGVLLMSFVGAKRRLMLSSLLRMLQLVKHAVHLLTPMLLLLVQLHASVHKD